MSTDDAIRAARRAQRLARYDELRAERPALFANPEGAAYEIVFDSQVQEEVANRSAAKLRELGRPEEYGDMGVIYEDAFFIALRDTVRFRDGYTGPYIRWVAQAPTEGAVVLPIFGDGRILLTRQFRHHIRDWQWETPRGFAEPGDKGPETAIRELREEIGITAEKVEFLGRLVDDNPCELWLARLDIDSYAVLPDGATIEGIDEFRLVTVDELRDLIASGKVGDGGLLAAYAIATARGLL
ncbi:NUDIX hydrolase [Paractinoplanes abujensis]|uniref:ADP-ribose pyrophosphatase n=1 Tax=Paractinoplanes abujensis TaxID=882441 RepID=A0A7W7CVS4_9ACTN|nr:NUDIX hydrolase [Actinoplanes abujensis]MBB4695594.1 ADP-ribose pyrophosphatase [Actinoplanes abujensis]